MRERVSDHDALGAIIKIQRVNVKEKPREKKCTQFGE